MANYLANDSDMTSVANAIRTKGGTSGSLQFPAGFVSAIQAIQTGVDCPKFTAVFDQTSYTVTSITCDKTFAECVAYINNNMFAAIYDDSQAGGLKGLGLGAGDLQNNIIYYGDADGPIPAIAITYSSNGTITWEYSPVPWKYSSDLTASGATVTAPAGYYASNASKSVSSGTEGTPIATKGTVSNHSVTVTPSVTNTEGYISGGTHTGTGVTVTASELESGTKSISANGTGISVSGYSSVDVAVPTGMDIPIFTVTENQSGGLSSISCNKTYTECSIAVTDGMYTGAAKWSDQQNEFYNAVFYDYGENDELIYDIMSFDVPSFRIYYKSDGTFTSEHYPIPTRSSSDLTASNLTVTAPAGYYYADSSKTLTDSNLTAANIKKNVSIFGVMGDLEGITCPIFTLSRNGNNEITTIICNISSGDCIQYYNNTSDSSAILRDQTWEETYGGNVINSYADDSIDYYFGNTTPLLYLRYYSNGTITWQVNPIASRSSSDLTASNLTVNAPAGYYASAASKTLTDSNLTAANIKKNVTIFGVTGSYEGSGGGGGLVYETGTYTPASDDSQPTISFANTHSVLPMYIFIVETSQIFESLNSALAWSLMNYSATGYYVKNGETGNIYGRTQYAYTGTSTATLSGTTISALTGTGTSNMSYYVTTTNFMPYFGISSRKFRASHTYKWIAVWAPTT